MKSARRKGPSDPAQKWHAYSLPELAKRRRELGSHRQLVAGILPQRAIGVVLGESGLGKTPLLYQLALAVASGEDFLGGRVSQGSVLYLDYENGLLQVEKMVEQLMRFFDLAQAPEDMRLWNFHDIPEHQHTFSSNRAVEMIGDLKPDLAIIDSLASYHPEAEEQNSTASRMLQDFRGLIRDHGTTVVLVHHLRKSSNNPQFQPPSLTGPEFRQWFQQARGASVLVNNSDVRLGLVTPKHHEALGDDESKEIVLFMRGFGRLTGEIPGMHLARCFDEEGEPLGHEPVTGSGLLDNSSQRKAFTKLPDRFRFKQAQQIYGKGAQATTDFLKKALGLRILEKRGKIYSKVIGKAE